MKITFTQAVKELSNYKTVYCKVNGGVTYYSISNDELCVNGIETDYRDFSLSFNQVLFGEWHNSTPRREVKR
jgi:hypothetical protein